jgi:hypothetical protein
MALPGLAKAYEDLIFRHNQIYDTIHLEGKKMAMA